MNNSNSRLWLRQAAAFGLFGVLGVAINAGLFTALVSGGVHYLAASFIGWLVALIVIFLLNRTVTFRSKGSLAGDFIRTLGVYLVQQLVFAAGLAFGVESIGLTPFMSYAINVPVAVVISFFGLKYFAMRDRQGMDSGG